MSSRGPLLYRSASHKCKIDYVNMQHNHVDMRHNHVDMQHNYVSRCEINYVACQHHYVACWYDYLAYTEQQYATIYLLFQRNYFIYNWEGITLFFSKIPCTYPLFKTPPPPPLHFFKWCLKKVAWNIHFTINIALSSSNHSLSFHFSPNRCW